MSLQQTLQYKIGAALNKIGTSVKITKLNGKSKSTKGVLTETTTDDLADTEISMTDKVVFIPGNIGFNVDAGDTVEFVMSKNVYTVIKTSVYNIDDVVANNIATKLYVRP